MEHKKLAFLPLLICALVLLVPSAATASSSVAGEGSTTSTWTLQRIFAVSGDDACIDEHDTLSLDVEVEGGKAPYRFEWYRSDDEGLHWKSLESDCATYTQKNVLVNSTGLPYVFRCLVVDARNDKVTADMNVEVRKRLTDSTDGKPLYSNYPILYDGQKSAFSLGAVFLLGILSIAAALSLWQARP